MEPTQFSREAILSHQSLTQIKRQRVKDAMRRKPESMQNRHMVKQLQKARMRLRHVLTVMENTEYSLTQILSHQHIDWQSLKISASVVMTDLLFSKNSDSPRIEALHTQNRITGLR